MQHQSSLSPTSRAPAVTALALALALALAAAVLATACGRTATGVADAADEQAVLAAADAWVEAYEARDLERLMTLYTDDAFIALHGQPSFAGKPAIRDYFERAFARAAGDFDIEVEEVAVHGDLAHVISKYWLEIIPHGTDRRFRDAGRSLILYRRGPAGDWLLYRDIDQATPDVVWPEENGASTDP